MKYQIVIDGKAAALSAETGHLKYQPEGGPPIERNYSVVSAGDGVWSILVDGRSYAVTLSAERGVLGAGDISVNGHVFHVEVFDPRSLRGRLGEAESPGPRSVASPMHGSVIRVLVEAGQEVQAGQGLIVVEAMKMQNEMKAPRAGRIASVKVAPGASVSAGEVLVVIE